MRLHSTHRRGVSLAKRQVAAFLAAELPPYLAELRTAWDLLPDDLPDPLEYRRNPAQALDKWPLIAVGAVNSPRIRRSQVLDNAAFEYDSTYAIRVFVWVRAEGWDRTIDMRDDLTTAVTSLLLAEPGLGVPDEAARIDDESLTENYSDLTPVKGDRYVAGAFISCSLLAREVVTSDLAGTVASTRVTGSVLPHPALE